jgi:hypothetical protein
MKKLLIATTAMSALLAAAPAAAQYGNRQYGTANPYNQGYNANAYGTTGMDNRLARIEARIQAGVDAGTIDMREARNLRWQLNQISRLDRQYSRNGYTQAERSDLQARLRSFRDQLIADGGGNGYGYGSGQYGSNGYDRGYSNTNNGYYGQGGPYEEACDNSRSSGGLGGLIDSIFGGDRDDCASLGVGARVSGNLGAVPYEYRNQYRDGAGYYYRSDGRSIYQIDTRTNTIMRVYPMNR